VRMGSLESFGEPCKEDFLDTIVSEGLVRDGSCTGRLVPRPKTLAV
jgi:hypothetical protein